MCLPSCFSRVQLVVTLWTVACQTPLSMGFSRQEFWSGLPCPSPGDLPNAGIELASLTSPASAGRFFTTSTAWEALNEDRVVGLIYLFLAVPHSMRDLRSPDQRLNSCPLWWKHGVLTTGFPGNLPDPGIELRSPTLQAEALTSAPPGKPRVHHEKCWTGRNTSWNQDCREKY